jgi:TldD protein
MSHLSRGWPALLALALSLSASRAAAAPGAESEDPVLRALVLEIERTMGAAAATDPAPYYLAVEVTETESVQIAAEEGALQGYVPMHGRWVDVDVRVGGPQLDSTHPLRSGQDRRRGHGRALVISDDVDVIRRGIWREVDARFVEAQERWAKVESDQQVLVDEEPADDLAATDPIVDIGPAASLDLDLARWEGTVRRASALLAGSTVVHDGSVKLSAEAVTHRFVSSEGTRLRHGRCYLRLLVHVDTMAEDGEELALSHSWDAADVSGLPGDDEILARVRELEALLAQLREAPPQDPYTGPAILTGRAAAVFFHEILGHRLEGHRLKRIDDAQTFREMVGQPILPGFLSVVDDPQLTREAGQDLRGHYTFDSQGERARRVELVEDGILTDFLQSRSPVRQGERSNGHGRRQRGNDAVSRQGNLIVEASSTVDEAGLRQALLKRVAEAGLEYGLLVDEISGGFTLTGRRMPNAFNVKVVVGYRIYVDGRPDELVRGLDLIGTPLVTFGRIELAGDRPEVFNGSCGAESGWVPVSAIAPSLLVGEVETQRKPRGQQTPPLLPPPVAEGVEP